MIFNKNDIKFIEVEIGLVADFSYGKIYSRKIPIEECDISNIRFGIKIPLDDQIEHDQPSYHAQIRFHGENVVSYWKYIQNIIPHKIDNKYYYLFGGSFPIKFEDTEIFYETNKKNIFYFKDSINEVDYTDIINLVGVEKRSVDIKFPIYMSADFRCDSLAVREIIGSATISDYNDEAIVTSPTMYREFSFMKNVPYQIKPILMCSRSETGEMKGRYLIGFELLPDDEISELILGCY